MAALLSKDNEPTLLEKLNEPAYRQAPCNIEAEQAPVSYTHLTLPDERSSVDLGGRRIIKKKKIKKKKRREKKKKKHNKRR